MDKGYKIRLLRERRGISQKEVALKLNVTQSAYSKMEACEHRITIENCRKIADIIGVDVLDIFEFDKRYKLTNIKLIEELTELKKVNQELYNDINELRRELKVLFTVIGKENFKRE